MGAHFIDKKRYGIPPHQCTSDYRKIPGEIMVISELRQQKIEPGKESDDKEQYQRVGKCEQETCHHVAPKGLSSFGRRLETASWIFPKQVHPEPYQNHTAENLQNYLIAIDKFFYERQTQSCQ